MNNYQMYFLLGKLLTREVSPEKRELIVGEFTSPDFKWDRLTAVANRHWLLQALYPRMRALEILNFLPGEIHSSLKMISELSQKRTEQILDQMSRITGLMNSTGIEPVFLKGSGHIIDQLYLDSSERIMIDIDFMVHDDHLEKAANLLLDHGYYQKQAYNPGLKSEIKHYPRLHHPDEIAPVEIHRTPVKPKLAKSFTHETVFRDLIRPTGLKGCFVLSDSHKLLHNFIHSQIEHKGHLYAQFSLRSLYDFYLLSKRIDPVPLFKTFPHYKKQAAGFMAVCDCTFGTDYLQGFGHQRAGRRFSARHAMNLRSGWLVLFISLYYRITGSYIRRPIQALWNKRLRKELLTKLTSKSWYHQHLKSYRRLFLRSRY